MADQQPGRSSAWPRVLVIGGGLAGIAAACELAARGCPVTLAEKRPYLGGRTFSFFDGEVQAEVDNGQHVFMRCCTAYLELLDRLGVRGKTCLQPRLRVPVMDSRRRRAAIASARLPAPFHLLPSLLRYPHLSWRDKRAVARAVLAMRRISEEQRRALDGISFAEWLAQRGQSQRAVEVFWDLVIIPTCNDPSKRVSAAQAIMVFQEGFLRSARAADIGYATVGLSKLLADEARQYIESRGGAILLDRTVEGLEGDEQGVRRVVVYGAPPVQADAYVLAVPPDVLGKLLPPALRKHPFFDRASRIVMSPIVNVHVWLDRAVTDVAFTALLDNEAQWVFNKSAMYGGDGHGGQHLCISLSAAHRHIDVPKEELTTLVLSELAKAFPGMRQATVRKTIVMRERFATFSPRPGAAVYRLPARTPVPNLFLAGEWTDTGWPSTMESAVRSGIAAAREALRWNAERSGAAHGALAAR